MTRTKLFTSLIASGLLATSAFAGNLWGGDKNSDAYGYVVNDLDKPAFVGTGFSVAAPRIDAYHGFVVGNGDIDQSGFVTGAAGPEKGHGDNSGWAVLDIGR